MSGLLQRLYERRQATNPTEGHRRPLTIAGATLLVLTLMAALFTLMTTQHDPLEFLRSMNGTVVLPHDALHWEIHAAPPARCREAGFDACSSLIDDRRPVFRGGNLYSFDAAPYLGEAATQSQDAATTFFRLRTQVPRALWPESLAGTTLVLALPPMRYEQTAVLVNGQRLDTFYGGERVVVRFRDTDETRRELRLELLVSLRPGHAQLAAGDGVGAVIAIAQAHRWQRYEDLVAAGRSGHGKQLADIARIVLAVFCLLLFLLVDSSPESLALATFMGIKAVGVIFAQNWLPERWLAPEGVMALRHGLLCLGDIMQLYFFTQLARVVPPRIGRWLAVAVPVAGVYALVQHLNPQALGVSWTYQLWKWRNVSLGVGCLLVAGTSVVYLARKGLYARSLALAIAFSGAIVQVAYPLGTSFPQLITAAWFQVAYNVLETHTPYVFALSTFINISTLETRVKALSREVVQAKEIERELALGKTVQQSLLRLPEVPPAMQVACLHEAAVYVSGDIYFVHWDESRQTLVMLINDVTGHGVQAALKASICTALADAIWNEGQVRGEDTAPSRFETYDRRLHGFLGKVAGQPEVVSFVGVEYDLSAAALTFYRANGVFPLLVEPGAGGWTVRALPLRNRELTTVPLARGGFALLLSDGLIDSSRVLRDLQKHLTEALATRVGAPEAEEVKGLVAAFPGFKRTNDDKTLLVFRAA